MNSEIEIIMVEDDPNDAELIMRVFRKNNLANKLVHLKDGAEAVNYFFGPAGCADKVANSGPKVVLLDLKLPKLNGIEVLRRIKSDDRTRTIPVVVLTSSREDRDLKDAYDLGVNSYVTKPIQFEEFAKVVTELGIYWLMLNRAPAD